MADTPYGARFLDEIRRLTNSTFGFTHDQIERIGSMDAEAFQSAWRRQPGPLDADWIAHLDWSSPEGLAEAIVAEGQRRADAGSVDVNPFDFVLEALLGLGS